MRNMSILKAGFGDILTRPKFSFIDHAGVYLGNGLVLHNSPEKGEHVSDIDEFASGREVGVTPTSPNAKAKIMERVQTTLRNPRVYDAPTNNCEHTVTRITEGRAYSTTVLVVCLVTVAIAAILISRR